jgi:hypothetical protein
MEGFAGYLRIVRKRGPQPFWTPVAPLHRVVSYPLSYLYTAAGLTPLAVTLVGLACVAAGAALVARAPLDTVPFYVGLGLVNLGVIHDACDGEVARYRIAKGLQSPATYRVGMFADFWAFAILTQALLPMLLGWVWWRETGATLPPWLGLAAGCALLSSYVVGFGKHAYWPEHPSRAREESFSFAAGGPAALRLAGRAYFYAFETAMFTTHLTAFLVAWSLLDPGGAPTWMRAYAMAVPAVLLAAFLFANARALARFDAEA